MAEDLVRIGFIGCGTHATGNLYPMLKYAHCQLVATCDLKEELARRNAEVFGAKAFYTDYRKMLATEKLDGVIVVGPVDVHFQASSEALKLGLPVLVEKPPAFTVADTSKLVELARKHNTFVMAAYMKRFGVTYRKILDLVAQGRFKLSAATIRYTSWVGSDLAGIMLYMAVHPIDLMIAFFGAPTEVTSSLFDDNGAICVHLMLRFADGRWATVIVGCHGPRIQERAEFYGVIDGKHGSFYVDNVFDMELHTAGMKGTETIGNDLTAFEVQYDLEDIKMWRPDCGIPSHHSNGSFAGGYAGEVREFVNAIREKRRPTPSNEDLLPTMKVVEAVLAKPNGTTRL